MYRPIGRYRPHTTRQLTLTLNPNFTTVLHRNYAVGNRRYKRTTNDVILWGHE